MALKLVNRVYSYIVIIINTIINTFLTNIDPFIYNIILYYTLYSEIELDNATATILKLANRVYSYAVTTIDTTTDIFLINTDLFAYNTTLYYTFTKFIGIIINIKTSKYFIIKYS